MEKNGPDTRGVILSFFLSLFMRGWWFVLALIYFILYKVLDLPLFPLWIILGLWVLNALLHTLLIAWGSSAQDMDTPGCQRTSERIRAREQAERERLEREKNGNSEN